MLLAFSGQAYWSYIRLRLECGVAFFVLYALTVYLWDRCNVGDRTRD